MGGGVQVEKRRPVSLTALFWRYLLTVGIGVAAAALAWWMTILLLLQWEAVLPPKVVPLGGGTSKKREQIR